MKGTATFQKLKHLKECSVKVQNCCGADGYTETTTEKEQNPKHKAVLNLLSLKDVIMTQLVLIRESYRTSQERKGRPRTIFNTGWLT